RAAADVERQDRGRRHLLPRRRQERAGLARLRLLPPGARRPAQQRGGARRQEAARPRRIHAEQSDQPREAAMNEDVFNGSLRRFLKKVGITSQREIAKVVLTIGGVSLSHEISDEIELG